MGKTLLSIHQNCHQSFVLDGIYMLYAFPLYDDEITGVLVMITLV